MVDIGGGTADLVTHGFTSINGQTKIVDLVEGTGDICAGSMIDDEFFKYMNEKVAPGYTEFAKSNLMTANSIASEWYRLKRAFSHSSTLRLVLFVKSEKLLDIVNDELFPDAKDAEEIEIPHDDFKRLFDKVVLRIFELIQLQIEQLHDDAKNRERPLKIILVGGLSESPYVQTELINLITKSYKPIIAKGMLHVYVSPQAGAAICRGAVIYGLNPSIFHSRRARETYGIRVMRRATEWDPDERIVDASGNRWVSGQEYVFAFQRLVVKGQVLNHGDKVEENINAEYRLTPYKLYIPLLRTDHAEPQYPDEDGVQQLGQLVIDVPAELDDRTFVVELEFSGPVIRAVGYPQQHPDKVSRVAINMQTKRGV